MIRYLDMLDALLTPGLAGLSTRFIEAQVSFVVSCQQPDGGFRGRMGQSDLYYTDFALRILALLSPRHEAVSRVAAYFSQLPHLPKDVIECFSFLNARRLLRSVGQELAINEPAIAAVIQSYLLANGGFAREPGLSLVSAYHSFLASLCYDCLQQDLPPADGAVSAMQGLRRNVSAGAIGFSELTTLAHPQTNATAAAVALLGMHEALSNDDLSAVATFLSSMQTPDGGLKAHPSADQSDLLSTFTGLLTLAMIEKLDRVDVASAGRFIRSTATPGGGFRACADDGEADVEYTYYGLGSLSLLRLFAQTRSE
jgi:geranylgeranyl transferase type-2 subunit beta